MKAKRTGIWMAIAASAALGACAPAAPLAPPSHSADPRAALPEPHVSLGTAPSPPKPLRRPQPRNLVAKTPEPPAPPIVEEATPQEREPAPRIVGLSEREALGLLGEPAKREDAKPARLWVYRGDDCELELSFFFDVSRNAFYILEYSARDARGEGDSKDRCLRSLRDGRPSP